MEVGNLTPKSFKSKYAKRMEKEDLRRLSIESSNSEKRKKDSPPQGQHKTKVQKHVTRLPQFLKKKQQN